MAATAAYPFDGGDPTMKTVAHSGGQAVIDRKAGRI